jgi:hypothetical protein
MSILEHCKQQIRLAQYQNNQNAVKHWKKQALIARQKRDQKLFNESLKNYL